MDVYYYDCTFYSHNTHGDKPSHISQRQLRIHSFVRSIHEVGVGDAFLQGQCPLV